MSVVGSQCLKCGDALGAGAIEGFCQRCLAAVAFDTTSDTSSAALKTGTSPKRRLGGYELTEQGGDAQLALGLGAAKSGRASVLETTLDRVEARFGAGAVQRASDLVADHGVGVASNLDFLDDAPPER